LGLGTTTPGYALDVNSTSRITQSNAGNTPNLILATPASNLNLKFFVDQIAAYDSTTSSALYLNYNGGDIGLGGTKATLKYGTGNFLIGTTTDGGSRLFIKGSGTTSSTSTFLIQNSAGTQALKVFDDTTSIFGDSTTTVSNLSTFYGSIDVKGSSATGAIINMSSASNSAITYAGGSALYIKSGLPNLIFQTNGANERMRIATTGNVLINTTTDSGYKLDVSGTGRFVGLYDSGGLQCSAGFNVIAGSGSSSGKGLLVGTNGLGVNGNSFFANSVYIGGNVTPTSVLTLGGAQGASSGLAVGALFATRLDVSGGNNDVLVGVDIANTLVLYSRTGVQSVGLRTSQSFAPVGLDTTHTSVLIAPTINQTGGSTGITRGLYINPTLTAAASWRSIEVATGNVLFNTTSGNVGIGTTTPSSKLHISSVADAAKGLIMNATTGTLNIYPYYNSSYGVILESRNSTDTGYLGFSISGSKIFLTDGNVNINTGGTDVGAKLTVKGSGTTSATTTLLAQNSAGTQLLKVFDDGEVQAGGSTSTQFKVMNTLGLSVSRDASLNANIRIREFAGSGPTFQMNGNSGPVFRMLDSSNFSCILSHSTWTGIGKGVVENTTAALQVDSTTRGFLPPRMLESNRLAITSPALGLMVYQTDMTEGLYIYKSAGWVFVI
jgi:hypothetical protein